LGQRLGVLHDVLGLHFGPRHEILAADLQVDIDELPHPRKIGQPREISLENDPVKTVQPGNNTMVILAEESCIVLHGVLSSIRALDQATNGNGTPYFYKSLFGSGEAGLGGMWLARTCSGEKAWWDAAGVNYKSIDMNMFYLY
jgi:hypothetical protein